MIRLITAALAATLLFSLPALADSFPLMGMSGGGGSPPPEVWSNTHINANLTGGGTTTITNPTGVAYTSAFGNQGVASGSIYFEAQANDGGSGQGGIVGAAIANTSASVTDGDWVGIDSNSLGWWPSGVWFGGSNIASNTSAGDENDRLAVAFTVSGGTVTVWFRNITTASAWNPGLAGTQDPATAQGGITVSIAGPIVPAATLSGYSPLVTTETGYFSSSSWLGAAPAGFVEYP